MPDTLPTVEEFYRGLGRMIVRFFSPAPGSSRVLAPHAILGCSGLSNIFLNCGVVFGDGALGDEPAEDRLREFAAHIRGQGVGGYLCLSEGVQRRLEPLARELGLEPLPAIPLMARLAGGEAAPAGARPPAGGPGPDGRLSCGAAERVRDEKGLAGFLAVSEAAFGLPADLYSLVFTPELLADPELNIYLVRRNGRAVSCVCVVDDQGLAGVSGMATIPELQGRGIGSDLLAFALSEHRGRASTFYLTASEAGQPLYRRHGFETVDAATAWVVPAPS